MTEMHFNEEDKKKVIEFLNMIAKHAKFELNTAEIIQYFILISHMQQRIIPKIDANIFEIKRVVKDESSSEPTKPIKNNK